MKITIVYDNESPYENLKADWGFACVVEAHGKTILFDTGARGDILLENMKQLGIEPSAIDEIFISHDHWDHNGGLADPLTQNPVKVWVPTSFKTECGAKELVKLGEPTIIHDGIFSTGELGSIEQAMAVETEKGAVVIAGCSHPGVGEILKAVSEFQHPFVLIGGFHGFDEYKLLGKLDLICATHCTEHISEISSFYPEKFTNGGVGKVIDI